MSTTTTKETNTAPKKSIRGFAAISPERRKAIASRGGIASAGAQERDSSGRFLGTKKDR